MSKSLLNALKKYNTFLISTHVNPDPDALTSELSMALYLKSFKKRVYVINEESVAKRYKFLPKSVLIKKLNIRNNVKFDAAVIVDCGDFDRIGPVQKLIKPKHKIINIDHHITNTRFGDYNLVLPDASSTAEIIYDLLKKTNFKFDRNIATLLYLGIMTDTGSFRFDNTTAHAHQIVGELMKFPIKVGEMYQQLYENSSLNDLKNFTKVVNNFEAFFRGKVLVMELYKNNLNKFSKEFDLRDKIFKYLRAIKGVEVVVVLTEQEKGKSRINFRSQGKVDVARLASKFNGGGHKRASGGSSVHSLKETKGQIIKEIKKVL